MDTIKQYLPWIIGGVVLIFILSRLRTNIVPQTALTQTPQPDPYAQNRFDAFQSLIGLAGIETQARTEREQSQLSFDLASRTQEIQRELGLSQIQAALQSAQLNVLQRNQDRQFQQQSIDRANQSRTTQTILGSINTALQGIFGNRSQSGGGVFGTPKTFPIGGFF